MLRPIVSIIERVCGIKIDRASADPVERMSDLSPELKDTIRAALPYTMTSVERLAALCMAVEHVIRNHVQGSFVECGVWKGGSSMAAALTYLRCGRNDTSFYLFDTFEGMSRPGPEDIDAATGKAASELMARSSRDTSEVWAYAPLEAVRSNMAKTGYPEEHVHYIQGKVEDTLPSRAPETIALLRLDTDWYESTKHELIHLFPRLARNGVLIIDDYGAWEGARKAVDEYFGSQEPRPFLMRIDSTGRILVRQ
jgi:O-methyltransferase